MCGFFHSRGPGRRHGGVLLGDIRRHIKIMKTANRANVNKTSADKSHTCRLGVFLLDIDPLTLLISITKNFLVQNDIAKADVAMHNLSIAAENIRYKKPTK